MREGYRASFSSICSLLVRVNLALANLENPSMKKLPRPYMISRSGHSFVLSAPLKEHQPVYQETRMCNVHVGGSRRRNHKSASMCLQH